MSPPWGPCFSVQHPLSEKSFPSLGSINLNQNGDDIPVEELQLGRMGLESIKHVRVGPACQLLHPIFPLCLSTGPLSCWSPLHCNCTDHTVKLSLILTRRAGTQLTTHFTKLLRAHLWELHVSVPPLVPTFSPLWLYKAGGKSVISDFVMHHHGSCDFLSQALLCCATAKDVVLDGTGCSEACH